MTYVDGFVAPVKWNNRAAYLEMARRTAEVFHDNGALRVVECWGDDVPDGKLTSFPMAVKCEEDEIVVFSWIEWPSKAVRDVGMKAMMEDPRMQPQPDRPWPFDGKRMIYGGFEMIMDQAGAGVASR